MGIDLCGAHSVYFRFGDPCLTISIDFALCLNLFFRIRHKSRLEMERMAIHKIFELRIKSNL